MPAAPLPCIVCGVVPERVFRDVGPLPWLSEEAPAQPYGATTFVSHGQYGSTVWDPMCSKQMLEINICDSCLTHAAHHQHRVVVVEELETKAKYSYKEWEPDE